MSSPQPPADGDRPMEAEPGAAASESAPASETASAAARPAPAKRTPSPRKRTPAKTTAMSPNGEAPEILDAMLGKAAADETVVGESADGAAKPATPRRRTAASRAKTAATPDTSSSPVEPPVAAEAERTEPLETEAATAVLPSADDYYRAATAETVTAETEILSSAEAPAPEVAAPEAAAPEVVPAPPAVAEVPVGAVAEEPATEAAAETPTEPADGPQDARRGRSVNELADRLDDSRFFSSLFDFTFTSYVTRKLAGPVYVVGLVLIGLGIVVGFANSLGIAIATRSPGGAFVFLLGVLVTLVAAILSVLLLRVTIEVFCAIIEIAQNTRRRRPPRD